MRRAILPTVAGMVSVLVGVIVAPCAEASDTCGTRCWETYGACYKSTSNRERCQGQLLRCLNNCIRANRKPASTPPDAPRTSPPRPPDPAARAKSGLPPPGPTPLPPD